MSTPKASLDDKVLNLFNEIQRRQKAIAASEKPRWDTTCTIGTSESSVTDRVNIQTVSDTNKLIDIAAFLLQKQDYWTKASVQLTSAAGEFKWMGYTVDQWLKDIKTRLAQVQLVAKRAELKTLKMRLDRLITTEQRRELELAAIQKEMGL